MARFDGSNTVSTVGSNYDHYLTSLGSINNIPIAVGDGGYSGNKKVESLQDGRWKIMGDFPFVEDIISQYSFVTFEGGIYIFGKIFNLYRFFKRKFNLGGFADFRESNLVAQMDENGFDQNIWTNMGTLSTRRRGHRSIVLENKIVHVGGDWTK